MKLYLIGGFLGSGKTTAIINACKYLMNDNKRVAVITNDQGNQQVDSALVKSLSIASAEVSNGCFCCNYDQLDKHIHTFIDDIKPDVVFAESVGSCTDLVATVAKPFALTMPESTVVISVFADATLLLAFFENRVSFINENVKYIYKKQLEEADLLIINKSDLVTNDQIEIIKSVLSTEYASKIIIYQNSFNENDIEKWLHTLSHFHDPQSRNSLEIDYDLYGDGEAQLAWFDKSLIITSPQYKAIEIANRIMRYIDNDIKQRGLIIGHLKFFIEADGRQKKLSATTTSPILDHLSNFKKANKVKLLINARVQTEPSILKLVIDNILKQVTNEYGCNIMIEKWAAFKPGYPKPQHRIS